MEQEPAGQSKEKYPLTLWSNQKIWGEKSVCVFAQFLWTAEAEKHKLIILSLKNTEPPSAFIHGNRLKGRGVDNFFGFLQIES